MRRNKILLIVLPLVFGLTGCKSLVGGFVLMSIIIGVPMMLLIFLGGLFSNLKHKGKYSSIDGSFSENLIGIIVLLLFIGGFIKACNG